MLIDLERTLKIENFYIVGFYPYTSAVTDRIISQSHNFKTRDHEFLDRFGEGVQELAESVGCRWDNKVVVELQHKKRNSITKSSNMFVGCYDGNWSVGYSVIQRDSWTHKSNMIFDPVDQYDIKTLRKEKINKLDIE